MDEIVIVSGVRTPVGKFQGSLSDVSAPRLGAVVVREAVQRAHLQPEQIDECIMGNVVSAGLGQNPARQAALFGGLPPEVSAVTVNMVCGSGLRAVALGAQSIQTGNAEIIVAGGMESMTNAPYLLPQARSGFRMGNAVAVDSMVNDGLWDVYNDFHMGHTAELVAEKYGISREDQDCFALLSHQKAAAAWREGRYAPRSCRLKFPRRRRASRQYCSSAMSPSGKTPASKRCALSSPPSKRTAPLRPATLRASTTRLPLLSSCPQRRRSPSA